MVFERLRQGQPVVEENVLASGATPEEERAALTASDIRSYIAIPLAKQNRLIGAVTICHAQPRRWQSDEV